MDAGGRRRQFQHRHPAQSSPYQNSALVLRFDIRRARFAAHQRPVIWPAFVPVLDE